MPREYTKDQNTLEIIRIHCNECKSIYDIHIDGSEKDDPTLYYN